MLRICLLLFAALITAVCIKKNKCRNKKAAPGNKRISYRKGGLITPMISKEIDKIKCKDIMNK